MINENNQEENLEVEEIPEFVQVSEGEEDLTDWKSEALKYQGIAKRFKTKFEKTKTEIKPEIKPNPEKPVKEGFDYAELAYLTAKGILDDDISFVEDTVKDTGKSLKDLLGAKWFQEELKDKQQERASKEAIPTGSNRAGSSAKDEVDYWIAKGEMPKNNPELARKVLRAMEKAEIDHSKFTDTPVIQ